MSKFGNNFQSRNGFIKKIKSYFCGVANHGNNHTHDTTRSIYLFNSRSIDFKCVCVFGRLLLSRKRWLFSSHKHFLRRAFANKIYRNRFFRFCTAFFDFSSGLQKQKKAVRTWANQYFSQLLFIRSIAESISKVTWRNICF